MTYVARLAGFLEEYQEPYKEGTAVQIARGALEVPILPSLYLGG
mgnify:CR=1 FL=1